MKEKLLEKTETDVSSVKPHVPFMMHKEHNQPRLLFVITAVLFYFVLGGVFYSYPMWLNLIITKHVSFSESAMSLMGGIIYVTLGLCGVAVMQYKRMGFTSLTEFFASTAVASVGLITSLALLNWLVLTPKSDEPNDTRVAMVVFSLILLGFSLSIFYMVWFEHLLALINFPYQGTFNSVVNIAIAMGALVTVSMKLSMGDEVWMATVFFSVVVALVVEWLLVLRYYDILIFPKAEAQANGESVTPMRLMRHLLFFRRQFSKEQLLKDSLDVSSFQFWCMMGAYFGICSVATTFLANLGPLTSQNEDTEGDDRSQIIVIIWSTVGQIIGRTLVPILHHIIANHLSKDVGTYRDINGQLFDETKQQELHQSRLYNRNQLGLTLLTGIIFFVSLISLMLSDNIQFIVATTLLSVGYGMMWSTTTAYPLLFMKFGFTFFIAFFQILGSMGTLIFTMLISVLKCSNEQTFTALLIGTIITVIVTSLGLVSRLRNEPATN